MAHLDKVSTTCVVPGEAGDEEEVISITERSSSSFTEEGGSDDLHPDLVSYSNDSLHDLDDREVSLDKLQWILSEIAESNDRFLSFVEDEGFLDVLDEMVCDSLSTNWVCHPVTRLLKFIILTDFPLYYLV